MNYFFEKYEEMLFDIKDYSILIDSFYKDDYSDEIKGMINGIYKSNNNNNNNNKKQRT